MFKEQQSGRHGWSSMSEWGGAQGKKSEGDGKKKEQMILSLVDHQRAFCSGEMQSHYRG